MSNTTATSRVSLPASALATFLSRLSIIAQQGRRRIGQKAAGFFAAMHLARMEGVLRAMTDTQLAQIDLKRADIPAHARRLTERPQDGM